MTYNAQTHRPMKVDQWQPTPELVKHAVEAYPKVDHERSFDRFKNHHRGRATKSSSWDAAFLNWLEQDADRIGDHREGGTDYKGLPNDSATEWRDLLMGRRTEGTDT